MESFVRRFSGWTRKRRWKKKVPGSKCEFSHQKKCQGAKLFSGCIKRVREGHRKMFAKEGNCPIAPPPILRLCWCIAVTTVKQRIETPPYAIFMPDSHWSGGFCRSKTPWRVLSTSPVRKCTMGGKKELWRNSAETNSDLFAVSGVINGDTCQSFFFIGVYILNVECFMPLFAETFSSRVSWRRGTKCSLIQLPAARWEFWNAWSGWKGSFQTPTRNDGIATLFRRATLGYVQFERMVRSTRRFYVLRLWKCGFVWETTTENKAALLLYWCLKCSSGQRYAHSYMPFNPLYFAFFCRHL